MTVTDQPTTGDPTGTPEARRVDDRTEEPLSTLRGAGGGPGVRQVGRVAAVVGLVALATTVLVLFVAAAHKNDQITTLHRHGVGVEVTVTTCAGLMGGSGSNAAGYACRGTFKLDGVRYEEAVPWASLNPPGTTLRAVTVPGDPALLATVGELRGEHASPRVFIIPALLLGVLVVLLAVLVLKTRRAPRRPSPDGAVTDT